LTVHKQKGINNGEMSCKEGTKEEIWLLQRSCDINKIEITK